jgi:hypothetical protein
MTDPCKLYQWTDREPYTFVCDLCAGAGTPIQTRLNTGRERMPDQMQRDLERLEALTNDLAERMPDQMQRDLERLEALTSNINDSPSDNEAELPTGI